MNPQIIKGTVKKPPARVAYDVRDEIWTRFFDHSQSVDTLAKRLRLQKHIVEDVLRGRIARRAA